MAIPRGSLELDQVSVSYDGHMALAGISLAVGAAEQLALVGPSGAGKTTLLRLLNGSVLPTQGDVRVAGRSLRALSGAELRRLRAGIGFVHQDLRLVPNLRVAHNVLAGASGRQSFLQSLRSMLRPAGSDLERVHALLERVGIEDKLFVRTDRLSGGQAQRVAIARALYQDPWVLVADEAVASLDPARARETIALLVDICREHELTLVVSLHNLELAREFFPRLIGLRSGRIVFDASPTDVTAEQFAALYRLDPGEVLADGV